MSRVSFDGMGRESMFTLVPKLLFGNEESEVGGTRVLARVLELLEQFARRPLTYVRPAEVSTVQSYLHGLEAGCSLAGLSVSPELYEQAAASRGWKWRAGGIVWHMRAKKLDDAAVIRELIAVEAEAFRLAAAQDE